MKNTPDTDAVCATTATRPSPVIPAVIGPKLWTVSIGVQFASHGPLGLVWPLQTRWPLACTATTMSRDLSKNGMPPGGAPGVPGPVTVWEPVGVSNMSRLLGRGESQRGGHQRAQPCRA